MILAGCGSFGALLTYHACQHKLAEEIHIYDFDVLTSRDIDSFYLYRECHVGYYKVVVLKELLAGIFPNIKIVSHNQKFDTGVETSRRVFDCRDKKKDDYSFTSRFSFDCNMLLLDSRTIGSSVGEYESHNYLQPKNFIVMNIAASVVCNYIKTEAYKSQSLEVIDFNKILSF